MINIFRLFWSKKSLASFSYQIRQINNRVERGHALVRKRVCQHFLEQWLQTRKSFGENTRKVLNLNHQALSHAHFDFLNPYAHRLKIVTVFSQALEAEKGAKRTTRVLSFRIPESVVVKGENLRVTPATQISFLLFPLLIHKEFEQWVQSYVLVWLFLDLVFILSK